VRAVPVPQTGSVTATTAEAEDQTAVETALPGGGRVAGVNLARFLAIAGAPAEGTPVVRGSSYAGRKRRSPQEPSGAVEQETEAEAELPRTAKAIKSRLAGVDLTSFLAIGGAPKGGTPVDPSGSYSGRRRRSPQEEVGSESPEENQEDLAAEAEAPRSAAAPGGRLGGFDLARFLAIAGAPAEGTPVVRGSSYSGRRRRAARAMDSSDLQIKITPAQYAAKAAADAKEKENISVSRVRRLAAEERGPAGLAAVPLLAVKVKTHGNHGNIAQQFDADDEYKLAVFNGQHGRVRRQLDNFIPFNVYDERRVQTLKIEQNDFLALPTRLRQAEDKEKNVKKRQFTPQ